MCWVFPPLISENVTGEGCGLEGLAWYTVGAQCTCGALVSEGWGWNTEDRMRALLSPSTRKQREIHSTLGQELWAWSQKIWVQFSSFSPAVSPGANPLSFKNLGPAEGSPSGTTWGLGLLSSIFRLWPPPLEQLLSMKGTLFFN